MTDFMVTACVTTGIVSIASIVSCPETTFATHPNPTLFLQLTLTLGAKAACLIGNSGGSGIAHASFFGDGIFVRVFTIRGVVGPVAATMYRNGIMTHDRSASVYDIFSSRT